MSVAAGHGDDMWELSYFGLIPRVFPGQHGTAQHSTANHDASPHSTDDHDTETSYFGLLPRVFPGQKGRNFRLPNTTTRGVFHFSSWSKDGWTEARGQRLGNAQAGGVCFAGVAPLLRANQFGRLCVLEGWVWNSGPFAAAVSLYSTFTIQAVTLKSSMEISLLWYAGLLGLEHVALKLSHLCTRWQGSRPNIS